MGLHACGDLTPSALRSYLRWPDAAAVVIVGCCYNLVTEPEDVEGGVSATADAVVVENTRPRAVGPKCWSPTTAAAAAGAAQSPVHGFPMSRAVSRMNFTLGPRGRTLAGWCASSSVDPCPLEWRPGFKHLNA